MTLSGLLLTLVGGAPCSPLSVRCPFASTGAAPGGTTGSGLFYVTYSNGDSPTLDHDDIKNLLEDGLIKEKFKGFYVLA